MTSTHTRKLFLRVGAAIPVGWRSKETIEGLLRRFFVEHPLSAGDHSIRGNLMNQLDSVRDIFEGKVGRRFGVRDGAARRTGEPRLAVHEVPVRVLRTMSSEMFLPRQTEPALEAKTTERVATAEARV